MKFVQEIFFVKISYGSLKKMKKVKTFKRGIVNFPSFLFSESSEHILVAQFRLLFCE